MLRCVGFADETSELNTTPINSKSVGFRSSETVESSLKYVNSLSPPDVVHCFYPEETIPCLTCGMLSPEDVRQYYVIVEEAAVITTTSILVAKGCPILLSISFLVQNSIKILLCFA